MDRAVLGDLELEFEMRGSGEPVVLIHAGHFADWFMPLFAEPGDNDPRVVILPCNWLWMLPMSCLPLRRWSRRCFSWLPNVEAFVLPNATHLLHVQNPRGMAEGLAAFFARHPIHGN